MSGSPGIFYWQDRLGKTSPHALDLWFQITGAKTAVALPMGSPTLFFFDALSTQAQIDNFLGTTNEFLLAAFDSTAMGADMFACIVNMSGQVAQLVGVEAVCYSAYATASSESAIVRFSPDSGLTASSLTTQADLGASGNLAVRVNFGNSPDFDGLTDAYIRLRFSIVSK